MGMSVEELLRKATDPITTTNLADGGLLTVEQFDRFVQLVIDESVMIKDARYVPMKNPTAEINKINVSGHLLLAATEGTDPLTRQVTTFTKTTLTAKKYILPWEVTSETLEDSIERGNIENTIMTSMATAISNDLEYCAIQGDTGSTDTLLAHNQGWEKLGESGHVVTWDGGRISRANLLTAHQALPTKWQTKPDLCLYFHNYVVEDWVNVFEDRATPAGDQAAVTGDPPPYHGLPFRRVPWIPTNCIGTWGYNAGPSLSYGFLTPKSNLLWGVHRAITLKRDEDIYADKLQFAVTTRVDVQWEETDAMVLILNVGLPT